MSYQNHQPSQESWVRRIVKFFSEPTPQRSALRISMLSGWLGRKHALQALRVSELKYRQLYESMADAYVLVGMSGEIQESNQAYRDMVGYSEKELLEMTYRDLTPEKWHAIEAQIIREQILPKGYSGVYAKEYRRKDGTIIPVELRTFLIRDEKGTAAGMWASIRDISRLKEIEEALNKSRQLESSLRKTAQAVEQCPASVIITDLTGAIEYVNPKFTEVTGYSSQEVMGRNPRLLKSGEMPAEEYHRLWETILQGREWRGQLHNRKKNGDLFWESALISPITSVDGKMTHFLAIKEDITAIKEAEKALVESEARYRLIADNVTDVICRLDPVTGMFSYFTPSIQSLLGYTQQEALQKNVMEFIPPGSQKRLADLLDARVSRFLAQSSGAGTYSDGFDLLRKDGSIIAADIASTLVKNEAGEVNVVLVVRDVTEQKRLARELHAEKERLEREVLRRIEMEQQRIGRDLHDSLCQVLVGIKYRLAVLNKLLLPAHQASTRDEINAIEGLLNESIRQARDLAQGLNPVELEENGLAISLEHLANSVQSRHGITCSCRFSPGFLIPGRDVCNHLYRIAQEALQNAIKHGKSRNISIDVRMQAHDIVLTVEDDGVGFPDNPGKLSGAGLHNMRTRAAMIGGSLAIRVGERGGCVVSLFCPSISKVAS